LYKWDCQILNFATQQNMCRRKMDENKVNEVKRYLQQFIKLSNMTWKSHNSSNINSNNVGFNVKFDCLGENCDDMLVITIELHMLLCIMIEICSILIHEICNLCCIVILVVNNISKNYSLLRVRPSLT